MTKSDEIGNFFYLSLQSNVNSRFSATTCGARRMAANPGRCSRANRGAGGGDKQWFTIDKTGGPGHGFQYQCWTTALTCSGDCGEFSARPMVASPGRLRQYSQFALLGTLDVDRTAIFLSVGRREHAFTAFARATHRSVASHADF